MPGHSMIGRVATLLQLERDVAGEARVDEAGGRVGEQAEAAEADDLPSTRAARSSGRETVSRVEPRTNSPGWSTKPSSGSTSTSRVRSGWSCAGSMTGYLWLSNSRKYLSRRTSMLHGWIISGSYGSMPDPLGVESRP